MTEAYTADEFREVFETNVFRCAASESGGPSRNAGAKKVYLIHVSSILGPSTLPYMAPYCSSKYALEAMSEAYRFELAPFGIDCVVVEPGAFDTPIFSKEFAPADLARRRGTPRPTMPTTSRLDSPGS